MNEKERRLQLIYDRGEEAHREALQQAENLMEQLELSAGKDILAGALTAHITKWNTLCLELAGLSRREFQTFLSTR